MGPVNARVAAQMTEHVKALAAEHGIRVTWVPRWRESEAFWEAGHVRIPRIKHPYDYLFCLHELGHCVSPEAATWAADEWPDLEADRYAAVLIEGAAWAWASAAALPSLTRHLRAKDWNTVAYAFRTYLAGPAWIRRRLPKRPVQRA